MDPVMSNEERLRILIREIMARRSKPSAYTLKQIILGKQVSDDLMSLQSVSKVFAGGYVTEFMEIPVKVVAGLSGNRISLVYDDMYFERALSIGENGMVIPS